MFTDDVTPGHMTLCAGVTLVGTASGATAACRCRAACTGRVSSRGSAAVRRAGGGASVTKVSTPTSTRILY